MAKYWKTPYYRLTDSSGKEVTIDVTSSVSAGLEPTKLIHEKIIPLLKERNVVNVLDFGAGALRHTFPLLDEGFEVVSVEFAEQFGRPSCKKAHEKAKEYPNFHPLVWPADFIKDKRTFGAALLIYVLQVMPIPAEREAVLKYIVRKLEHSAYLFYMSRFNQRDGTSEDHRVNDGWVKGLKFKYQSFYTEFATSDTHDMMARHNLRRIRSISERGTDQAFVYAKGNAEWI